MGEPRKTEASQGHAPPPTCSENKYYIIFIDDYSCFIWIYFMHKKSKHFQIYKIFLPWFKFSLVSPLKFFISTQLVINEYFSNEFHYMVLDQGILSSTSARFLTLLIFCHLNIIFCHLV